MTFVLISLSKSQVNIKMPPKKSNIDAKSRDAKRVAQQRAQLNRLPRPEDSVPLSEEELQREREMNEAIFAEFMAKYKKNVSKESKPVRQSKPKLRTQPRRNIISAEEDDNATKELLKHRDYNEYCNPPPLLEPVKSVPCKILQKEARKNRRAELLVARKKRVELRAEKKKSVCKIEPYSASEEI